MKSRVGILNFQFSRANYGALLQAAALEFLIKEQNYSVEHIDLVPTRTLKLKQQLRQYVRNIMDVIGLSYYLGLKQTPRNIKVFDDFRNNYLSRTPKRYKTTNELAVLENKYDAVVVGSDQVWRPEYCIGEAEAFFLSFVGPNTKRISYAASFGKDKWECADKSLDSSLCDLAVKFDSVSVREESGIKICQDVFSIEASHVLDPTLLVGKSFFESMLSEFKNNDSTGVVYYVLDDFQELERELNSITNMKKSYARNIYNKGSQKKPLYSSVPEWLHAIKNSDYVVTDSFHCVCFAILFEKQFIYSANPKRGLARLESLFKMLDIPNRISIDRTTLSEGFKNLEDINYKVVNQKLEELRGHSSEFLFEALSR